MSILSFLGIVVFFYSLLIFATAIRSLKEANTSTISTRLYLTGLTVIIVTEIVLAWHVGPGLYGIKFFN